MDKLKQANIHLPQILTESRALYQNLPTTMWTNTVSDYNQKFEKTFPVRKRVNSNWEKGNNSRTYGKYPLNPGQFFMFRIIQGQYPGMNYHTISVGMALKHSPVDTPFGNHGTDSYVRTQEGKPRWVKPTRVDCNTRDVVAIKYDFLTWNIIKWYVFVEEELHSSYTHVLKEEEPEDKNGPHFGFLSTQAFCWYIV